MLNPTVETGFGLNIQKTGFGESTTNNQDDNFGGGFGKAAGKFQRQTQNIMNQQQQQFNNNNFNNNNNYGGGNNDNYFQGGAGGNFNSNQQNNFQNLNNNMGFNQNNQFNNSNITPQWNQNQNFNNNQNIGMRGGFNNQTPGFNNNNYPGDGGFNQGFNNQGFNQRIGSPSQGFNNNPMSPTSNVLDQLLAAMAQQCNNPQAFDSALSSCNINAYSRYMNSNQLESLCQRFGVYLNENSKFDLIQALNQDQNGQAKIAYLKDKVLNYRPSSGFGLNRQQSPPGFNATGTTSLGSITLQMNLEKIKNTLKSMRQTDLSRFLNVTWQNNKTVVEMQQFLHFITSPQFDISQKDAMEIVFNYLIESNYSHKNQSQMFVDLEAFEADICDGPQIGMNLHKSMISMNSLYEQIRKFVMMHNGNIYAFFKKYDLDNDGYISRNELKNLVYQLGYANATEDDINNIYQFFDYDKDGRIQLYEMMHVFQNFSNITSINDQSHWAFYIFDNLRRIMITENKSLAQVFGIQEQQINSFRNKIYLSKDQLLNTLTTRCILVKNEDVQHLLVLLGADYKNNFQIDFFKLQELVGVQIQNPYVQQYATNFNQTSFETQFLQRYRKFYRQLISLIKNSNYTISYLLLLFRNADPNNSGLISITELQAKLTQINHESALDINYVGEVLQKYLSPSGLQQLIRYKEFLQDLEVQLTKYNAINSMFATLDASLQYYNVQNIQQLFLKLGSDGGTNFTKQMLQITLAKIGIYFSGEELSLIQTEYSLNSANDTLDFDSFNKDFEEYRKGGSAYNPSSLLRNQSMNNFKQFVEQRPNKEKVLQKRFGNINSKKLPEPGEKTNDVIRILTGLALDMEGNFKQKFLDYLQENDISNVGEISEDSFSKILQTCFGTTFQDQQILIKYYTAYTNRTVIVYQFLDNLGEYIQDLRVKTSLAVASQYFMNAYTQSKLDGKDQTQNLQKFIHQFEEIFKAIISRGFDTFKYFENISHSKQNITKQEFQNALLNLSLKSATANDINEIFTQLDQQGKGFVEIIVIDSAIKQTVGKSGNEMVKEIQEQILKSFSGDDVGILEQLRQLDPSGRGKISIDEFVQFFIRNAPSHSTLSINDLQFLSQHYMNQRLSKSDVDYQTFHTDLKRVKQEIGYYEGGPSYFGEVGHNNLDERGRQNQWEQFNPTGMRQNPLQPNFSSTNTRTGMDKFAKPPFGFRVNIEPKLLEDLIKGTFLKGRLVSEFFQSFVYQNSMALNENQFAQAIQDLKLDWTYNQTRQIFSEIDRVFNKRQPKLQISPEEIDQTTHFTVSKTVEQLQQDILNQIAYYASQNAMNMRGELTAYDRGRSGTISVDAFQDFLLNRMLMRDLNQLDVRFLAVKYIQSSQNQIHIDKFLADFDQIFRQKYSHIGDFRTICDYIKKCCIINNVQIEKIFQKHMRQFRDQVTYREFEDALTELGLVPQICNSSQLGTMFNEIDNSRFQKVTLPQITNYINKVSDPRQGTKEFIDEIMKNLIATAKQKSILIDQIFKSDDPMGSNSVQYGVFENKMINQFYLKQIDARLLSLKYIDQKQQINYRNFLLDFHRIEKDSSFMFQDESQYNFVAPNQEVKTLLMRIGEVVASKGIQLGKLFQQHERGQKSNMNLAQSVFFDTLKREGILFKNTEVSVLISFYGVRDNSQTINHRKFLEDLKTYAINFKPKESLTKGQRDLFEALGKHLKEIRLAVPLVQSLVQKDPNEKGHLTRQLIEDSFKQHGLTITSQQFDVMIGVLSQNKIGEFNYKQMLEYLLETDEANKLYTQAIKSRKVDPNSVEDEQILVFQMPSNPINPLNGIMGEIGRKVIASNINIEEEFKKKVGNYQQSSMGIIKVTDIDIIDVLLNCNVQLSQDEKINFEAFVIQNKEGKQDQRGGNYVYLVKFLSAIGLPPQTISLADQLPKKILSEQELAQAQSIIFNLKRELARTQRRPVEIFERFKRSQQQRTLNQQSFSLALSGGEFGIYGQQMPMEQIQLLIYYLQEETPGEISLQKLYHAFTLESKDQPLKQYGHELLEKYQQKIKRQLTGSGKVPLEILDLIHFMRTQQFGIQSIWKTNRPQIPRSEFENGLRAVKFVHNNLAGISEGLLVAGSKQTISLEKLNQYMNQYSSLKASGGQDASTITAQMARDLYTKFDPKVRAQLQKISDFLKREGITIKRLYTEMDADRNGGVDQKEFVTKISSMNIPGVFPSDLAFIFNQLDLNNDGNLSINEFGMFLEGAKASQKQRLEELDPKLIDEMVREIQILFKSFDENNDGFVSAEEIYKSMLALGQKNLTLDDAKTMIAQIDSNGDNKLDLREFTNLLLPKLKEEFLKQEDSMEDLRSMFLEADLDHSGSLSVDEIYSVLLKMGVEVKPNELIELMNEIDVDRNGSLDIDEFVALMNMGNEIQFKSAGAKNTFYNIKRVRKLNPLDFFKQFKNMPMNFVPSFFQELWVQKRKNLPASVFIPQLDPKTMLFKDLYPLMSDQIPPSMAQKAFQPRLRPLKMELGCQIVLEVAQGVPIPKTGTGFERSQIVKRAIRIGLFDTVKKEYQFNVVQVNVIYNQNDEDMWKFNSYNDIGMNPVLFKTSNKEQYAKGTFQLIFELVIYCKFGDKITEMSCGWCQLDTSLLDRAMTHKLPIKGGSPTAELSIDSGDVHTKRTGINYIMKMVTTKIASQLQVSIRPHTKFTEETKFHMDLLPSTCLIQKQLLYFVSGYRNYIGDKLLKESAMGTFKHPEGDVIISTFPKLLNNPDICEQLLRIFQEDFWKGVAGKNKVNVEYIMRQTVDYIKRLYPVVYAEEFRYRESNPVESAAGDQYLVRKREDLINAGLRYGVGAAKIKATQPVEALTTFKPFTVRELEFEIWDTSKAKQEQFMRDYDNLGLLTSTKENVQFNALGQNFNQNVLSLGQQQQQQFFQQKQMELNQQRPTDLFAAMQNNRNWN